MTAAKTTANGSARRTKSPAELVGLPSAGQPDAPWDHGETRPDGRPWFRHELFPLELTKPDVVARWFVLDQKCEAKGGDDHPEVLEVAAWSDDFGGYVEMPGRYPLAQCNREWFVQTFAAGKYMLTAYTWCGKGESEARERIATRTRPFYNNGADELEEPNDDEDDDEDDDDEEEERSTKKKMTRAQVDLEREKMRLQAAKDEREDRQRREDNERAERNRRDDEERKRREDNELAEKERQRIHEREIEKIRAGANRHAPAAQNGGGGMLGQLRELAELKKLAEVVFGAGKAAAGKSDGLGTKLAIKAVEAVENIVIEVGAPLAGVYAKQHGVDVDSLFPKDDAPAETAAEETADEEEGGDES